MDGPNASHKMRINDVGLFEIIEVVDIILMDHLSPVTTINTLAFIIFYTIDKKKLKIKLVITILKRTKNVR